MEIKVLDNSPNNVIAHISGRQFPALMVQGDTFHNWVSELKDVIALAQEKEQVEITEELEGILESFEERLSHYEAVLSKNGIERPY